MINSGDEFYKKAKVLSTELYPTIGGFVVAFESLCHSLKTGVEEILLQQGLSDGKLAEILIGDMTLFPLQSVYRSLLVQAYKLDAKEISIIDNIFKRVCEINEERNGIIHSAWFIDFKNPNDIEKGLLMKYRPGASKHGAKESPSKYPLEDIKKSSERVRILINLVEELNMCVYRNVYIASRFNIDVGKNSVAVGTLLDHFQTEKPPVAPAVSRGMRRIRRFDRP
jgi:hypothetical protein